MAETSVQMMIWFYILSLVLKVSDGANITDAENLYNALFTSYNQIFFPVLDLDDPILVHTNVGIVGINKFDEINGEIDITCVFRMHWVDERLTWTPSEYGGKTSMLIPSNEIWYPKLYLMQSFEKLQIIGSIPQLVRIHYNGTVQWSPANVLKVICSVDVTYFPFDTQSCILSVSTWLYTVDELRFLILDSDLDLSLLNSNGQWNVKSGFVSKSSTFNSDIITVELILRRLSDFFVVYIIIPIVCLGAINNLVFVMPASSGERTSVAITAFLSFVVFMEMINTNVPESSSPLAYIYYYILFLLLYSSLVLFLCIISLRIHDKDGEVPPTVKTITTYLMFWRIKCRKKSVSPKKNKVVDDDEYADKESDLDKEILSTQVSDITWKIVGKTYDKYCGVSMGIVYILYTTITMLRLYSNAGL